MAAFSFSDYTNNQHITFDPAVDVLNFVLTSISANGVMLTQSGADLVVTANGISVVLDATTLSRIGTGTVSFADGSALRIGDGTSSILADWYGQSLISLASSTVGNQVQGLGGADVVQTGSGADLLIGNIPLSPLAHINTSAGIGSPTSAQQISISADGNFVGFSGGWTAFGSTNDNATDVFVKNLAADTVSNEHLASDGSTHGNSGASAPVISADGNTLVFQSASSNLVDGAASASLYDIYAADVLSVDISRVNVKADGTLAADGRSIAPDVSNDGRYVSFVSDTTNFADGATSTHYDVFLKDRDLGALTRLSTSLTGGDGDGESRNARISADGRYVVFDSVAKNLAVGDSDSYYDVFLWDRLSGSLTNLTEHATAYSTPYNDSSRADVAYDNGVGGVVVFQTSKGLVAADTNYRQDIYAYNIATHAFTLVSATASGTPVSSNSEGAAISGDGRFVTFTSYSNSLTPGDTHSGADVFVKDLRTGAIALVSTTATGLPANAASNNAQISLGGDWIVFESSATNIAGTEANGSLTDIYKVANPLLLDTLAGSTGNDIYVLDRADVIVEALNAGIDTVKASLSYTLGSNLENLVLLGTDNLAGTGNTLANVITGNEGNNVIDGGGGLDTASYAAAAGAVTVNLSLLVEQTTGAGQDLLRNIENLTGSDFADVLNGNASANVINGGAGGDSMLGGNGADTYYVDDASDVVSEANASSVSGGIDLVMSLLPDYTLPTNVENGRVGVATAANLTGNSLSNTIFAGAGANNLQGSGGTDTVSYQYASAAVVVSLGKTTAQTTGGSGLDTLLSFENLTGSSFADQLTGNSGNNLLRGLGGKDVLVGGAGKDVFVFDTALGASTNLDRVSDYSTVNDTIHLENAIFTRLTVAGALSSANFKSSTTGLAADANDYVCYNTRTGALSYDADGSGHGAAVQFASVWSSTTAHPALTLADFVVI